ncbi:hypothetical protein [Desulfurella sp.]|uniref:hypothetical protein n=1 Tax=Desulfurella sp. TaxID=1962857 RepID=UPI0025C73741|nr:hypothetical protein [Desulfurella sp.]
MIKKLLASCVVVGLMVSPVLAAENAKPAPAKNETKVEKKAVEKKAVEKKAVAKKAPVKKEAPKKAEKTEKK